MNAPVSSQMKDIHHILSEAVSLLPVGTQQQAREAIKDGQVTPQIVAALIAKLELTFSETKNKSDESPVLAKVDSLASTIRSIEQRIKESSDSRGAQGEDKHDKLLLSRMEGLRADMRKMEDGLAALEPYQHWKVFVLMGLSLAVGGLVGWYVHSNYKTVGARHHYTEVQGE